MSMLQLEVVTPDKTVVSAQVEMAVCPGVMGEFGVLPHHVSLLSRSATFAILKAASSTTCSSPAALPM